MRGWPGMMLMLSAPASAQYAPPAESPRVCTAPEFAQFDFWVGEWEVYPTEGGRMVARSRVEKLYNGCAIRENWMQLNGNDGGSLSTYVASAKQWRQLWTDSAANWVESRGGFDGKAMVLTGTGFLPNGVRTRMTYSRNLDGSVRQVLERASDDGTTWVPTVDLTYRPAKKR